jgi:hypothetical protein
MRGPPALGMPPAAAPRLRSYGAPPRAGPATLRSHPPHCRARMCLSTALCSQPCAGPVPRPGALGRPRALGVGANRPRGALMQPAAHAPARAPLSNTNCLAQGRECSMEARAGVGRGAPAAACTRRLSHPCSRTPHTYLRPQQSSLACCLGVSLSMEPAPGSNTPWIQQGPKGQTEVDCQIQTPASPEQLARKHFRFDLDLWVYILLGANWEPGAGSINMPSWQSARE